MARFANNGSRGRHGRHAGPEEQSPFFQAEQESSFNPYKSASMPGEGPIPYANRREEVARLRRKKKHHGNAPKIIAAVVIVVVLVFGATGAAFAMSAMDAKDDAQTLMTQAKQLKSQVVGGDMAGAKETASQMSEMTTKLHDTTSGPLWSVATLIPVVGSDIQTVRTVSDAADALVDEVLMPAMDVIPANGLAGLMSNDGAVNVKVIDDLLTVVSGSAPTITEYAEKLNGAPEPAIGQLKEPIQQVKDMMSMLGPIAGYATELKDTLPAMLGADGARNYLIIACSSAEMRSSVGFAGSFGVMTVDNGKISLGSFIGYEENLRLETPVPAATEEDIRLFRTEAAIDARDVTQIIDFERVGEIEAQIWAANGHGTVDGVIGMDTVVLQRMLELTGTSVTTPGGDVLDGSNTSDFLLNGVYKKYPEGKVQNAIFALVADTAAKGVFGNIGKVNIAKLAGVLKTSVDEGRISIYMANDSEEAMLEDFGLAGTVSSDTKVPETGVYMSACLGGKMFYYLASDIEVGKGVKNADGSVTYDMKVTFSDLLDEAELSTLTRYIKNGDEYNGSLHFFVYLLAPTGGKITDLQTDGVFYGADRYPNTDFAITAGGNDDMNETTYQGNDLWYGWTKVPMEGTTVITYKVTTSPEAETDLVVRTTPLSGDTEITYQ